MRALLYRERSVREGGLDLEGGGLDARLLGVRRVVDLGRVAMAFGPAQVHPQQHGSEVGRVDATGLGANGDQRLALVVLPGQQRADLEGLDRFLQRPSSASAASSRLA